MGKRHVYLSQKEQSRADEVRSILRLTMCSSLEWWAASVVNEQEEQLICLPWAVNDVRKVSHLNGERATSYLLVRDYT